MDYLELVHSLDHTSLAYLCASLWGVRAIAGLVLGDGVTDLEFFVEDYLRVICSAAGIIYISFPLLFSCISDSIVIHCTILLYSVVSDIVSNVVYQMYFAYFFRCVVLIVL